MKRIIMLLVLVLAVTFTAIGVVKEQTRESTGDVSQGLNVIANQSDMAKSVMSSEKIVFSADDFERSLNLARISSITIVSLPNVSDGCLCIGDVLVNEGQTISRENLDLLNYRAGNGDVNESQFKFKVNGSEYLMTCSIYFLERPNSAPTLAMEDERIFNVSTHQSVRIYGRIGAYDPDGDDVRYEIVSYAKNGTIDLDMTTGEYTYTPTGAYFGEDSFMYVAVDKYGNYSSAKNVNLTVEKRTTDVVYCDMDDHPSHHAALTMTEKGIMSGTSIGDATYFMPDKSVSRMDFLVMLMHAIGVSKTDVVLDTGFDDDGEIPASMKGYVYAARQMGIISGAVDEQGNYYFHPNRNITRAEAALIIKNVVNGKLPTVKPTFADRDSIPTWAHDAVYALNDLGILVGINGEFAPDANMTRAQAAQTFYALLDHIQ